MRRPTSPVPSSWTWIVISAAIRARGAIPSLTAPCSPGRMGELGIGDDHTVIAYDDRGGAIAARLWWMLRWIGHDRVAVLDGGLVAWQADGHSGHGRRANPPARP